jgi:hypothetical protein
MGVLAAAAGWRISSGISENLVVRLTLLAT